MTPLVIVSGAVSGLLLMIWLFNFIYYLPFSVFKTRMSTSQGRLHLFSQCTKFGFFKSSLRNFIRFISRIVRWRKQLAVGKEVFDGEVYDLNGNKLMLKEDYLDKIYKVIKSYTYLFACLLTNYLLTYKGYPSYIKFW